MRKRVINGKRVMALALALSMVIGEASMISAAPLTDTTEDVQVVEQNPEATQETEVSNNDITPAADENITEDAEETEDAKDIENEDDIIAEGAYDGTPSQVIGLDGNKYYYSSFYLPNGKQLDYSYVRPSDPSVTLLGKASDYKYGDSNLYTYNGVIYHYCDSNSRYNSVTLYSPVNMADGKTESFYNKDTGLYTLNGKTYGYLKSLKTNGTDKSYADFYNEVVSVGKFDDFETAEKAFGQKLDPQSNDYDYYMIAGNLYKYISYTYTQDNKVNVYVYLNDQFSFTAQEVNLNWTKLSTSEVKYTADGKRIQIGYQVEENGVILNENNISADGQYVFLTGTNRTCNVVLNAGQSANFRVRGLYYYKDEVKDTEGHTKNTNNVIAVGEWSDTYTYTAPVVSDIPVVTGVKAALNGTTIDVTWDNVPAAGGYWIYSIKSNVPLDGLTAETWEDFEYGEKYYQVLNANPDANISFDSDYSNTTHAVISKEKDYTYYYFNVVVSYLNDSNSYSNNRQYSQVAAVVAPSAVNIPQVQNLKVENKMNGSFDLAWNPVDANVIVYAYEAPTFPQYYNYSKAYALVNGSKVYLTDKLDVPTQLAISKVQSRTIDGLSGGISAGNFNLKTGVTYYFVAYTYDDNFNTDEKPVPVATIDGIAFNHYTDLSPVSNMVSAKINLVKPYITSASFKNSIQLNLDGDYATGYEIYKKSGKKYKKLAVTTDNNYVDENLKENSKYYYKVRSYYYNKDSKAKCYSDYVYITAETSASNNIVLNVTQKSTTSAYLKWSKVDNASKYEIYRSNSVSYNPLVTSKKYSNGSAVATAMGNNRYELIKTINKNSTTKYTDKKLVSGDDYTYVVVAYYKNAGKVEYISGGDSISLYLETPSKLDAVLKGSSAKVTWEANKYAAKYEIEYNIMNADGVCLDKAPKTATTKKNSYTIKNIPNGGYAIVRVRAYGKDKKYSSWTEKLAAKSLAATSNIKAVNTVVENKNVVKISWKAVSGAKYYKVYRSTKMPVYNADTKRYLVDDDICRYIAKSGNDDEGINSVSYDEYLGEEGSISGTTAYDNAVLDNGVTYYYTVVAFGEKNTVVYTQMSDTDASYASGKPAKVVYNATPVAKVKSAKAKKVTLTYAKVAGASKYEVYRADKKNGKYKKVGSTKNSTYVDKSAKKGKTYYYKVVANGTNALQATYSSESNVLKVKVK